MTEPDPQTQRNRMILAVAILAAVMLRGRRDAAQIAYGSERRSQSHVCGKW